MTLNFLSDILRVNKRSNSNLFRTTDFLISYRLLHVSWDESKQTTIRVISPNPFLVGSRLKQRKYLNTSIEKKIDVLTEIKVVKY